MIDINKKYKTRDGQDVRIYATDIGGDYPIHGAIRANDGWALTNWTKDGCYYAYSQGVSSCDLVEVKPRVQRTVWINVYKENFQGKPYVWPSKEKAIEGRHDDCIATVEVTIDVEEGHGL